MSFNRKTGKYEPDYPFTTDNCTLFFDGDWKDCCIQHDRAYWKGGDLKLKREADRKLAQCVRQTSKLWLRPLIAALMWFGVSWGGWLPIPNARWGFAYKWPRYGPDPKHIWPLGTRCKPKLEHPLAQKEAQQ